jgi:hypothetical protein
VHNKVHAMLVISHFRSAFIWALNPERMISHMASEKIAARLATLPKHG